MTKRTFQIVMLTAAIWLAAPGKSEATTLSFSAGTDVGATAFFTGYDFELVFDLVNTAFTVDVTAAIDSGSNLPTGYTCVPIDGGTNCILFTATPSNPNAWTGDYTVTIFWVADTNAAYPNTPTLDSGIGRIRILHFTSAGVFDITEPGSYCATGCALPPPFEDPAIGGKDDNFSDFMVVQAQVPEPGTMVLLGTGLALLAVRLRRRRRLN